MTRRIAASLTHDRTLRMLAEHAVAIRQLIDSSAALYRELGLKDPATPATSSPGSIGVPQDASGDLPIVDRDRFSVLWRKRSCRLGNTLPFRFFESLLRRRGRCCSHEDLLDEVWEGVRAGSTVRHVVKRLRDRLTSAGMEGLARAIDGSERGHYVLRLENVEEDPTEIQQKAAAPANRRQRG